MTVHLSWIQYVVCTISIHTRQTFTSYVHALITLTIKYMTPQYTSLLPQHMHPSPHLNSPPPITPHSLHLQVRLSLIEPSLNTTEVVTRAKAVSSKWHLNTTNRAKVYVWLMWCMCVWGGQTRRTTMSWCVIQSRCTLHETSYCKPLKRDAHWSFWTSVHSSWPFTWDQNVHTRKPTLFWFRYQSCNTPFDA